MCGIHGIVYFNKAGNQDTQKKVKMMLNISKHRGPDESEVMPFEQAVLGTNRLAIVAPAERSTVLSLGSSLHSIFNGEIVNYKKLRTLLKNPPNLHTDTALILPLYEQLGPDFVKHLAGMFAIAIYDKRKNTLQLWRDPLGIKPLYYYFSNGCVVFSSEIKAIYAVLDDPPEVDFAAIDHSLRFRFHPGQSSVFPQIKRVLPGETVLFKNNKVVCKQFWTLTKNKLTKNKAVNVEEFRSLLYKVLEEQAQADVKGGFFVSGGLDSSLVSSVVLKMKDSPYKKPISIKFLPHPVEDEMYGKILEKFLKTKFEWVEITDKIARQSMVEIAKYLDEPLENPIHIGTYLMAKRAKELGIKSVLTGDGSDEFFLGYARHTCWFDSTANPSVAYPKWLWTLKPEEADELYTKHALESLSPMVGAVGEKIEPFVSVDQALRFERLERLSEYHNMRLDRMTMANGVEARVPFLDHRIVEYALNIPLKTLFGSSGKGWLQDAARPWLPEQILNRAKVHFPSLPDQWLSGVGSDWVAEILLDQNAHIKKWIKTKVLERYIREHKNKARAHGRLLWALVSLELWLQNLTDWRK